MTGSKSDRRGRLGLACLWLLVALAGGSSSAQPAREPLIEIIEFELDSTNDDDVTARAVIQKTIRETLQRKGYRVDFVSTILLNRVRDPERHLSSVVIRGRLRSLEGSENELHVEVSIQDKRSGDDGAEIKWTRTLTRQLEEIHFWSERIAHLLEARIAGKPPYQLVFTHCFDAYGQSKEEQRLRFTLPRRLKASLEEKGLGGEYQFKSFDSDVNVRKVCGDSPEEQVNTDLYDYVISGHFTHADEERIHINISIHIPESERDEYLDEFQAEYHRLAESLAEFIVQKWTEVVSQGRP